MADKMQSELAVYDLASGDVTTILKTPHHIEAPNWTRDGTALIINGGGFISRVDLATGAQRQINTGRCTACNNDHGLSPDGSTLVISNGGVLGESRMFTLPITGGEPKPVSDTSPSYWHGWSPDGQRLAYVGNRGAGYQVFTIPVEGGDETQLTHDFDHCDGPDYTPDGKWIWFNGERAGQVQLWRMRPDGQGLQQMTHDERVNWFPHPSPDGRHVVYLAYEPGTLGHPANRNVELRLMPAEGGAKRVLLKLFGGQGTINVPSWAPDSQRFAFVRYQPA